MEETHRRCGGSGRQGRQCPEGEPQQGYLHKPKDPERGDGGCFETGQGVREQSNTSQKEYQIEEDDMVQIMTQDTKDRIANLERQKIELENRLEFLGYSGNLVRMHQIEEEIFEIEDTIKKLLS